MPSYEYKCRDCGYLFEQVLTIAEHERYKPQCAKCKSKNVEQVMSSFFAKTDSKT